MGMRVGMMATKVALEGEEGSGGVESGSVEDI
jgi:hypothetical protein